MHVCMMGFPEPPVGRFSTALVSCVTVSLGDVSTSACLQKGAGSHAAGSQRGDNRQ